MKQKNKKFFLLFTLSALYALSASYAFSNEKKAEKKTAAPPTQRELTDPLAKVWDEANTAVSAMYYSDPVDKNPDEGVKAQWQAVIGLMYKALDIMRKGTHPSQGIGGEGVEVHALLPYFTETQGQMRNALDQIYVTKGMLSSLDGRGRTIIPQAELFYQQLEIVRISLAKRDYASYERAFESLCRIAKTIDVSFQGAPPPKYSEVVQPFPKKDIISTLKSGTLFVMIVTLAVFVGVFLFVRLPQLGVSGVISDYFDRQKEKMKKLAYEYNRQFLGVGAGWLLYGPLIVSVVFGLLTMNLMVFLFALFVFGYLLPTEGLKFVKERRRLKIEAQLLDAMILLSDAMKSGLDLIQGIELAVHEMPPPISEEFDLFLKNYKLGQPFEEALKGMNARIESDLMGYVVRAILIQRQTGGNLTKIFDRIVDTIREESKLKDKINALTAGPRMQSVVISVIPWGMLMILYFFQPKAVGSFFVSFAGVVTLLLCVFWQTVGLIVIRRMARIEV